MTAHHVDDGDDVALVDLCVGLDLDGSVTFPATGDEDGDLHLHRLEHDELVALADRLADLDPHLPHVGGDLCPDLSHGRKPTLRRVIAMDPSGKRVLVTGASRGIGEAVARAFAGAGATVALVARNEAKLRALASELGDGATVHPTDLLEPAQVATLLHRVEDEAGPVDVVVNNAGIGVPSALWELDPSDLEQTVRLNLTVPLELCRQAIPRMLRRGRGHLVNVSSLASVATVAGMSHYAATKAGLAHGASALRHELKGLPIGVTTVLVGGVPTDMLIGGEAVYEPFHRGFVRLRRTQLVPDTPAAKLAAAVVEGVRRGRRTVYLPKRAAPFVGFVEAPRRIVELALTGVPTRR